MKIRTVLILSLCSFYATSIMSIKRKKDSVVPLNGKKKTKVKGKWIRVDQCRYGILAHDGKTFLKLPYAELLLKE